MARKHRDARAATLYDIKHDEQSAWFHLSGGDFTKTTAFKDKATLLIKGTLSKKQAIMFAEQTELQRMTDAGEIAPNQFPHRDKPVEQIRVNDNSRFGGP